MSLQLNTKDKLEDADASHIYVDLDIINNDNQGLTPAKQLSFNEIRNNPYVLKPNKYFFSVVRFQIDTPTLPVFIPQIEPNQADVNKTIYKISIEWAGVAYTGNIEWQSEIYQAITPSSPVGATQALSEYYYCFNYNYFLSLINLKINQLMATIPNLPSNDIQLPLFSYDENTSKISLQADSRYFITGSGLNPVSSKIYIYINAPLQRLLSGFCYTDYGYPPVNPINNPLQYRFKIFETYNNYKARYLPPDAFTSNYDIVMTSEQLDIALWNPVKAIVFTSGLIPVNPTLSSPPKTLDGTSLGSFGNNANLSTQITDFEVGFSATNTYKQTINYVNTSEYRLIDITSDIPLTSINISVFWKNMNGQLIPFYLNGGSSGALKLMFRRKDFNNTQYLN
jgi:hypothetical protein